MANNSTAVRKPTKKQMFASLKEIPGLTAEQVAFIDHEIELLERKNSSEKKPTANQVANDALKNAIVEGMEHGVQYTVSDLMKTIPACAGLSNQKVSPLANQLVEDGRLVKTTEKRRSYFSLPSVEG